MTKKTRYTGIGLSTFTPVANTIKGGIKSLGCSTAVIVAPVAGDLSGISQQAQEIHQWLLETVATEQGKGVDTLRITREFGERKYFKHMNSWSHSLRAFPLEELIDASLLYLVEDNRFEQNK